MSEEWSTRRKALIIALLTLSSWFLGIGIGLGIYEFWKGM